MYIVYVILPIIALSIFTWGCFVGWAIAEVAKLERWDFTEDRPYRP